MRGRGGASDSGNGCGRRSRNCWSDQRERGGEGAGTYIVLRVDVRLNAIVGMDEGKLEVHERLGLYEKIPVLGKLIAVSGWPASMVDGRIGDAYCS